jgi:hypothetical protein
MWLLAVRIGLRSLPFLRLRSLLERGLPPLRPLDQADAERESELAWAVDVAARNTWPWPPARCLPRALVLERLLRAEGVPAEMRIGVRVPGAGLAGSREKDLPRTAAGGMESAPGLDAHAWVECAGRVVGDRADVASRFTVLRPAEAVRAAQSGAVRGPFLARRSGSRDGVRSYRRTS